MLHGFSQPCWHFSSLPDARLFIAPYDETTDRLLTELSVKTETAIVRATRACSRRKSAKVIAQGVAAIASDRAAGKIKDDDVRFIFERIRATESSGLSAIKATAKAAAQDAINAALNVAASALNAAVGTDIL